MGSIILAGFALAATFIYIGMQCWCYLQPAREVD